MKQTKQNVSKQVKKEVEEVKEQVNSAETAEAPKEVKTAKAPVNPYIEALNSIVNNAQFRDAIETIVDTRFILASKELDASTANACTLVINRELKHISEAVSKTILGV